MLTIDSLNHAELSVPINLEKIKQLEANEYIVDIVIEFKDIKTKRTGSLKYLEKGDVSVSKESSGFIVKRNSVTKNNEGNVAITVKIDAEKKCFI